MTKTAKENTQHEEVKQQIPAIVALSHPCSKLPMAAVSATSTAPLILNKANLLLYVEKMNPQFLLIAEAPTIRTHSR